MRSAKSVGRIIGVLMLVQLAGLIAPFVMLMPMTAGPSAVLAHAAGIAAQIKLAVFLLFANGALTIGIGIAAFRVLRPYGYATALLLVAVSVIWFSQQAADNAQLLSLLSLSQRYAQTGGQDEMFQALAAGVGSTRRWAHYTELLVIDGWMFVLYTSLYRSALVPRPLAAFGLVTVLLHFTGIPLLLFLGHRSVTLMGVAMGLSQLALALWLMVRGFEERWHPVGPEAQAVAIPGA